jgi:hypothetical protein
MVLVAKYILVLYSNIDRNACLRFACDPRIRQPGADETEWTRLKSVNGLPSVLLANRFHLFFFSRLSTGSSILNNQSVSCRLTRTCTG